MQFGLVGGCFDPESGDPVAYRFDARYGDLRRTGPASIVADMLTIAEVVKRPDRVFRGLRRNGKDSAFAFLGRPPVRFELTDDDDEPRAIPVEGKKLFFVYVDQRFCIYHHAWIDLDFESPGDSAAEAEDNYVKLCFAEEIPNARRN